MRRCSQTSRCKADAAGARTRSIVTPPANGGKTCLPLEESQLCNTQACKSDEEKAVEAADAKPTQADMPAEGHTAIFDMAHRMSVEYKDEPDWAVFCIRGMDSHKQDFGLWSDIDSGCAGFAAMAACAAGNNDVPRNGEWVKCSFDPQQCGLRRDFNVEPEEQGTFENLEQVPDGACLHFGDYHSSVKGTIDGTTYVAQASADGNVYYNLSNSYTKAGVPLDNSIDLKFHNSTLWNVQGAGVYTDQQSKLYGFTTDSGKYVLPALARQGEKQWWCKKIDMTQVPGTSQYNLSGCAGGQSGELDRKNIPIANIAQSPIVTECAQLCNKHADCCTGMECNNCRCAPLANS